MSQELTVKMTSKVEDRECSLHSWRYRLLTHCHKEVCHSSCGEGFMNFLWSLGLSKSRALGTFLTSNKQAKDWMETYFLIGLFSKYGGQELPVVRVACDKILRDRKTAGYPLYILCTKHQFWWVMLNHFCSNVR